MTTDPFADAMLRLADRLFTEFDDLPVMTVMRAICDSRAELEGDIVDVNVVEVRARRRLHAAKGPVRRRAGHSYRWLAAPIFALPVLSDVMQSSLAA
jgi:hypothetical protein